MRNFLLKLIAFIVVLTTIQVAVSALNPPELPEEILALDQQLQAGVDTLYFGDSILIHPVGEPTIPEILRDLLPDYEIGDVAHPAYQLDLYERYVNYLVNHNSGVKTVIIPINLRSFSPEWDLRPTYQFEREKTILTYGPLLSTIFYRPFDTFGLFDSPISQTDFQTATVFNGDEPVGVVADFEALTGASAADAEVDETEFVYHDTLPSEEETEALEGTLIYYYMDRLDRNHRKLQSMKAISRLLTENGIKPIFYITPINYELGERHLGTTFRDRLAENSAVVERALRQKGLDVLNLVFALEAYNFVDTEHLTESGKIQVAQALATAIEGPGPDHLTSTPVDDLVDDGPTPRVSVIAQPNQPAETPIPLTPVVLSEPSPTAQPTPTATQVITATPQSLAAQQAGQLVSAEFWSDFQPVGNYNIDAYRLRYKTVDWNERVVEVEANLYVPHVEDPTEFPILIYAPGTTGLSDECAPLNELGNGSNWGAYHSYMLDYSAQGFIGVLPNYQGLGDESRDHPYFVAEFQARALLDAARAAFDAFDQSPNLAASPMEAVIIAGYSSGGHATFAAKDFVASYAPEVPLKGVIGHGPTTNLKTLFKEDAVFSPYIVQSYRDFYGPGVVNPANIFQDRWLTNFEADVMSRCVDALFRYYSTNPRQMYRPEFIEALFADRLQAIVPDFEEVLEANSSGLSPDGVDIPVLILQGTGDQVVTPPSQMQFAGELCRLGNHVTYISYPAVSHGNIRRVSFRDTINWMEGVASGELAESSCASLTDQ